jgi:hypothetical protein
MPNIRRGGAERGVVERPVGASWRPRRRRTSRGRGSRWWRRRRKEGRRDGRTVLFWLRRLQRAVLLGQSEHSLGPARSNFINDESNHNKI